MCFLQSKVERKGEAGGLQLTAIFRIPILLAMYLAVAHDTSAQSTAMAGTVEGTVFVVDSGVVSLLPGARIALKGSKTVQTESDAAGIYSFREVKAGAYTIEASYPGMKAEQTVVVESGAVVKVALEMKLIAVNSTVTVTGSSNDAENSTAAVTIPEKTIVDAPNASERFDALLPLVPGVVRGPDGHINMKGARNTQSGALVNSANVTDPASGSPAINLPIDVVSSVRVLSNPYDPQYGKLTGALSTVETKTGNYDKFHFTVQNVVPRLRDRDGTIAGIGAATPRMTFTGPLLKDRLALTQSFEYRFVRTPVNSLPPLERDTKLVGFSSYTQLDLIRGAKQTVTASLTVYPQKLDYMGLSTFTPQPSTADFRQRGYEVYAQHRYITGPDSVLISQFSYKTYNVDINAQSNDPYRLLIDTTEGGFFNRQSRRSARYDWEENYQFAPRLFLGSHQIKIGVDYTHSSLNGLETFLPVELIGSSGAVLEQIAFTSASFFSVDQNETAAYIADQWAVSRRLSVGLGLRMDRDTVTNSTHIAPRVSVLLSLTNDGKTLLKGGAGTFYDRVALMLPIFEDLPARTVTIFGSGGTVVSSTAFANRIVDKLTNPRSTSWNIELERQVTRNFTARVGYEQRNTARDFVLSPATNPQSDNVDLSNGGSDSYREFQVTGRYQLPHFTMNASYVRSRAYGNLNDPFLFIGNYPQPVIQPDAQARQLFDAPNRLLFVPEIEGPWKLTISSVYDLHTGFPYSVQDEHRDYIGPRNVRRFPRFSSYDLQVTRPVSLHAGERRLRTRIGFSVFNLFNHFNPRDVQNNIASSTFGDFYNDAWREYRGKLVFEF